LKIKLAGSCYVPVLLVCALWMLPACSMTGRYAAAPQRPSFSSDTGTTAQGTIEAELGVAVDDQDQVDTPVTVKWGAGESSELFLSWSPYVRLEGERDAVEGAGDVVVGTRYRFTDEGENTPSAAFQLAAKVPTADDQDGLGSGEVDFALAGIVTKVINTATLVGYYEAGVLGVPSSGEVDIAHGIALAMGHPLLGRLNGFLEVAGVFIPDQDQSSVFSTLGAGYEWKTGLVLDSAVTIGLTDDASDLQFTIGTTINLGNLFAGR